MVLPRQARVGNVEFNKVALCSSKERKKKERERERDREREGGRDIERRKERTL